MVRSKEGRILAKKIVDEIRKTGKSDKVCPKCGKKPYAEVDLEYARIKCECGYLFWMELGI